MKMPAEISTSLIAPCGLVCLLCRRHCEEADSPCEGCRGGHGKSAHCRSCDLLSCAQQRGLRYCAQCADFPCERLTAFDAHYRKDYGHALLPNSLVLRDQGEVALLGTICRDWTCPDDGGVICIHGDRCSECGKVQTHD